VFHLMVRNDEGGPGHRRSLVALGLSMSPTSRRFRHVPLLPEDGLAVGPLLLLAAVAAALTAAGSPTSPTGTRARGRDPRTTAGLL
jgi:hypothetical protein